MTLASFLSVGLGGFIGSVLRYVATIVITNRLASAFPYATFTINIVGSFVIGLVMGLALKGNMSENVRLFFATGLCGGFTTFSAFSIENLKLLQSNEVLTASLYIIASILVGVAAAGLGFFVGKL